MIQIQKTLAGACLAALLSLSPSALAQVFDEVNGLWKGAAGSALIESIPNVGVRIRQGKTVASGTLSLPAPAGPGQITGTGIALTVNGLATKELGDDTITGTVAGKTVTWKRDMAPKPPITVAFPGDRPWVRFMQEILMPKTAEDRESWHTFNSVEARKFLTRCQLYRTGYWQNKYMKGATRPEQNASFDRLINSLNGTLMSARKVLNTKFSIMLQNNLSDKAKPEAALAVSSLGMYFSTAAGGAVRLKIDPTAVVYYITDRRANSKFGLVVMDTPGHAPLASSFGKLQGDFGKAPITDDKNYARAIFELMTMSKTTAAKVLTPLAKSSYTDYLGIMAIEDQRGVMFNNFTLNWGYNMTNGALWMLIVKALSHGQTRPGPTERFAGKPELASQVLITDPMGALKLVPGDPTYADILNGAENWLTPASKGKGGNDFQERGAMATLKQLTTKWLTAKYPAVVQRVVTSLAPFRPAASISPRAQADIFHRLVENFYDYTNFTKVTKVQAKEIVDASMVMVDTIYKNSRDLEAFILANGATKGTEWAPRASGF